MIIFFNFIVLNLYQIFIKYDVNMSESSIKEVIQENDFGNIYHDFLSPEIWL